jgi:hypothetical protein
MYVPPAPSKRSEVHVALSHGSAWVALWFCLAGAVLALQNLQQELAAAISPDGRGLRIAMHAIFVILLLGALFLMVAFIHPRLPTAPVGSATHLAVSALSNFSGVSIAGSHGGLAAPAAAAATASHATETPSAAKLAAPTPTTPAPPPGVPRRRPEFTGRLMVVE